MYMRPSPLLYLGSFACRFFVTHFSSLATSYHLSHFSLPLSFLRLSPPTAVPGHSQRKQSKGLLFDVGKTQFVIYVTVDIASEELG